MITSKENLFVFLSFCFLCCYSSTAISQDDKLDQFYRSELFPKELNTASIERLNEIYKGYLSRKGVDHDEEGQFKNFVYRYNYFQERLNKSGSILYANELEQYLNQLKDRIVRLPADRTYIRVYLTNFTELNAFTNDFGAIYINIGTLAKLESEEELLVILAHEISHVLLEHSYKTEKLKHSLESDIESEKLTEISEFEYHQFSQVNEIQADSMAFHLLSDMGIDISAFHTTLERLRAANAPVTSGKVDTQVLFLGHKPSERYFNDIYDAMRADTTTYKVDEEALKEHLGMRLSTHPTILERIQHVEKWDSVTTFVKMDSLYYSSSTDYSNIKSLATRVYLQSLLDYGYYIEGLYLTAKLREVAPEDASLIKLQIKFFLLLVQKRYQPELQDFLINAYGNSCPDKEYLAFRKAMLSIPPVELNVLTSNMLINAQGNPILSTDPYMERMQVFSNLFLYKNNAAFFRLTEDGIRMIPEQKSPGASYHVPDYLSHDAYKTIQEHIKMGFQYVLDYHKDTVLINDYLRSFTDYHRLHSSIAQYKELRNRFEKTLTPDKFFAETDPGKAFFKYRKGEYTYKTPISNASSEYLIQSDSYYFNAVRRFEYVPNFEKTLWADSSVNTMYNELNLFDGTLSNHPSPERPLSVKDNRTHYAFSSFIDQCWELRDLVYTSVDEEIYAFRQAKQVDYGVYNLNLILKAISRKEYFVSYIIYFDLDLAGVVYLGKVGGHTPLKSHFIKNYLIHTYEGKN